MTEEREEGRPPEVAAFRQKAAEDVDLLCDYAAVAILEGSWLVALTALGGARRELLRYMELLGVEITPEEEEAVEEPVKGTLLEVLGLPTRVYNAMCRSRALAEAAGIPEGDLRRPHVEEVLYILETRGEQFFLGRVKHFGPKALKEMKEKLQEKGFLPAEEEAEED